MPKLSPAEHEAENALTLLAELADPPPQRVLTVTGETHDHYAPKCKVRVVGTDMQGNTVYEDFEIPAVHHGEFEGGEIVGKVSFKTITSREIILPGLPCGTVGLR